MGRRGVGAQGDGHPTEPDRLLRLHRALVRESSRQAARRERAVLLADALGRLPEHYREVIILSHLEGLSFPEVARRMGRSVDGVKNLWARALGQLRRSLVEDPLGEDS